MAFLPFLTVKNRFCDFWRSFAVFGRDFGLRRCFEIVRVVLARFLDDSGRFCAVSVNGFKPFSRFLAVFDRFFHGFFVKLDW